MIISLAFHLCLCILLIWLAWHALSSASLFSAITSFIAFGLLMALTWVELHAPDIALAEAALGTGLTSVLLLSTLANHDPTQQTGSHSIKLRYLAGGLCIILWLSLILVLPFSSSSSTGPAIALQQQLQVTGIEQPVTEVLLIYRAFDTLLEVAVLILALFIIRSLYVPPPYREMPDTADVVLSNFTKIMIPLTLLVGYYLFWKGSHAPGGAFQAAAILAAGAIFVLLSVTPLPQGWLRAPWFIFSICGFIVFLAFSWMGPSVDQGFFGYPAHLTKVIVIIIEAFLSFSLAVVLVGFVTKGRYKGFFSSAKNPANITGCKPDA